MSDCQSKDCEAHRYVMDLIEKLEGVTEELKQGQADIKETIVKLTENLLETQRVNDRFDLIVAELKAENKEQSKKIDDNSSFVNKAIGVVGAISLFSAIGAAIIGVLQLIL